MRRAARVDANHADIVQAFKQMGATVLDLSRVGGGCPDLLVGYRGANVLVEVKIAKGKKNKLQEKFFADWKGPCFEVRTVMEAFEIIKLMNQIAAFA